MYETPGGKWQSRDELQNSASLRSGIQTPGKHHLEKEKKTSSLGMRKEPIGRLGAAEQLKKWPTVQRDKGRSLPVPLGEREPSTSMRSLPQPTVTGRNGVQAYLWAPSQPLWTARPTWGFAEVTLSKQLEMVVEGIQHYRLYICKQCFNQSHLRKRVNV